MTLLFPIVFFSVLDYTYFNWRKNSMKVKNSLDEIDVVSGATCSSSALLEACRQALESAKIVQQSE